MQRSSFKHKGHGFGDKVRVAFLVGAETLAEGGGAVDDVGLGLLAVLEADVDFVVVHGWVGGDEWVGELVSGERASCSVVR